MHDTGNRYIEFRMRGEGYLFKDQAVPIVAAGNLDTSTKAVFDFLRENGASYGRDLQWALDLSAAALNRALQQLVDKGLVSCESYQSLAAIFQSRMTARKTDPGQLIQAESIRRPVPGKHHRQTKKIRHP